MAGPTLVIDLAGPPSSTRSNEFDALIRGLSTHFERTRRGYFDIGVPVERLSIAVRRALDPGETDDRPFLVHLMGPGFGDESLFEAEHADEAVIEAALGFKPTHAVNVSAGCNQDIDHVATALLTAAIIDVLGGVVKAELPLGQERVIAGLPGVLGLVDDGYPTVLGTAAFLRAWVERPGFRLLK
ncbi:DUF6368 family protein [Nocardiopsis alba]|uniref:DUF6368 family protein n=1 Tax=Nocardiopsis alba TaxID=53437 RepID=UPI0035D89BCB